MRNPIDVMHDEVSALIEQAGGSGVLSVCTGGGKTKIAIDRLLKVNVESFIWVVPTTKLRDKAVPDEFKKWNAEHLLDRGERVCYKSLHKIKGRHFTYVILDEWHRITEKSAEFFENNTFDFILCLSATEAEEREKRDIIFIQLGLKVIYRLALDEAVEMGIVAPYQIHVIRVQLDSVYKRVLAGPKTNQFYTTETKQYEYFAKREAAIKDKDRYAELPKWLVFGRQRFLADVHAKYEVAKGLLEHKIDPAERVLVFAGTIEQCEKICEHTYHSKTNDDDYNAFNKERVNVLGVVNAINEGDNLTKVDKAIITQINRKSLKLIQRLGRIVRYRPGHEAILYITIVKDTEDENWLMKALSSFDKSKVKYFKYGYK